MCFFRLQICRNLQVLVLDQRSQPLVHLALTFNPERWSIALSVLFVSYQHETVFIFKFYPHLIKSSAVTGSPVGATVRTQGPRTHTHTHRRTNYSLIFVLVHSWLVLKRLTWLPETTLQHSSSSSFSHFSFSFSPLLCSFLLFSLLHLLYLPLPPLFVSSLSFSSLFSLFTHPPSPFFFKLEVLI